MDSITFYIVAGVVNLLLVLVAIAVSFAAYRNVRHAGPAIANVDNCDERIRQMQAQFDGAMEEERGKRRAVETENARLSTRLSNAELAAQVALRTANVLMDRLGIPVPAYPPPVVKVLETEGLALIGVWADHADKPTLNLQTDLEGVLRESIWDYHPLAGRVSGTDLEKELAFRRKEIKMVYFAGHADPDGVYFSSEKRPPEWFGQVAREYRVRMVFLNACKTASTARAIFTAGVPAVVYALRDIEDGVAIQFAKSFFSFLAISKSVSSAVASAQRDLMGKTKQNPKSIFGVYGDWTIGEFD